MIENISPDKTVAIVVGIEKYQMGERWNLDGPARQAARFINWLSRRGVPSENILRFLSPLKSNESDCRSALQSLAQREHAERLWESPDRDVITKALTERLSQFDADLLFLFWGGHGVMESDQKRYLLFANASPRDKAAISLDEILRSLRAKTKHGKSAEYQVIFNDSCANYFEDLGHELSLAALSRTHISPDRRVKQFVMHAAAAGERADNGDIRPAVNFSNAVLGLLERRTDQWPDVLDLKEQVVEHFDRLSAGASDIQTPVFFQWSDWKGNEGAASGLDFVLRRLKLIREAREQLGDVHILPERLSAIYRTTLRARRLQLPRENPLSDRILADLSEHGERGDGKRPAPLHEFLYRVGKEAEHLELCEWVKGKVYYQAEIAQLELDIKREATAKKKNYLYLLINLSLEGACRTKYPSQIQFWICEEDTGGEAQLHLNLVDKGIIQLDNSRRGLQSALRAIIEKANKIAVREELFLEIFVTRKKLFDDFDQWEHREKGYRLGASYAVVLRLAERFWMQDSAAAKAWKNAAGRIGDEGGCEILWLPHQDFPVPQQAEEHVKSDLYGMVGLTIAPTEAGKTAADRFFDAVLRGGAPFVFWPRRAPRDADGFCHQIGNAILAKELKDVPQDFKRLRLEALSDPENHPGSALSVLWDDPARDPTQLKLEHL